MTEQNRLQGVAMYYGWNICILASLGNFLLQGGVMFVINAFIEPLCALHGWTRTDIATSLAIGSFCSVISVTVLGLVCRGPWLRALMTLGAVVGGAAYILMGQTSHWGLFTLLLAFVWIGGQLCGGCVGNVLICNWFSAYRGRAMGVANMGTSFSGAVLPFAALLLIQHFSVGMAYALSGALLLALAPFCWSVVRNRPEDVNLYADGAASPPPQQETVPLSLSDLLRDSRFYLVGISMGIGLMAAAGVMSQMKPRFVQLGMDDHSGMALMCLCALCGACGKYLWGMVCDRVGSPRAARALLLANAGGLALAFLPPSFQSILLFSVVYGMAFGGLWTVFPALVAHIYGPERFFSVYRYAYLFVFIQTFGYWVMGFSFDASGTYQPAYFLFLVLLCIAFVLICLLRNKPVQRVQAVL